MSGLENANFSTEVLYLNSSVDENAVANDVVVVEVASNNRRPKMYDDASDIDHQYAKHSTTNTAAVLGHGGVVTSTTAL